MSDSKPVEVDENLRESRLELSSQRPWPSLQSFRNIDEEYFQGREAETEKVLQMMRWKLMTVIFGVSGLGKTSLLNAGLFPKMKRSGYIPVDVRLDYKSEIDLVSQVKNSLSSTLREAQENGDIHFNRLPNKEESLWEYFHRPELNIYRDQEQSEWLSTVLVFDQFERFFTFWEEADPDRQEVLGAQREELIHALAEVTENWVPQELADAMEENPKLAREFDFSERDFHIIISLREDYLPQLESLVSEIPSLAGNRFRLLPMNRDQAREVILGPGKQIVTPAVAEQILDLVAPQSRTSDQDSGGDDVLFEPVGKATESVNPALLSLFCFELNERRLSEQPAPEKIEQHHLTGGEKILEEFYDRCFEKFDSSERKKAERVLQRKLLLSGRGLRDSAAKEVLLDDFVQEGVERERAKEILESLREDRFLQFELKDTHLRVELTHDVLAREVARQMRIRREEEELVRKEKEAEAARQARIRQEKEELARKEKEGERLRRKNRSRIGVAVVIAVITSLASLACLGLAKQSKRDQETAESLLKVLGDQTKEAQRLRADAEAKENEAQKAAAGQSLAEAAVAANAIYALPRLADAARRDGENPAARTRLATSFQQQAFVMPAAPRATFQGSVSSAQLSSIGDDLIVGGSKGGAAIYPLDPDSENAVVSLEDSHPEKIVAMALGRSRNLAATGSMDGSIKVWSTSTGEVKAEFNVAENPHLLFTPENDLVAGSADGDFVLLDVETGRELASTKISTSLIGMELHPKGESILVYGSDPGADGHIELLDATDLSSVRVLSDELGDEARFIADMKFWRGDDSGDYLILFSRSKTGSDSNNVRIISAKDGTEVLAPGLLPDRLQWGNFSPSKGLIISASRVNYVDTQITFWALNGSDLRIADYFIEQGEVHLSAFSSDSKLLVTANRAGIVRFWDASSEKTVQNREMLDFGEEIVDLFVRGERELIVVTASGQISRWCMKDRRASPFMIEHEHPVRWSAFFDEVSLVSATSKSTGLLRITKPGGDPGYREKSNLGPGWRGIAKGGGAINVEKSGILALLDNHGDCFGAYWDLSADEVTEAVHLDHEGKNSIQLEGATGVFDESGTFLATISKRGHAKLFQLEETSLKEVETFNSLALYGLDAVFKEKNLLLGTPDGLVYKWMLEEERFEGGSPGSSQGGSEALGARFSFDGSRIAFIHPGLLSVCTTDTGLCVRAQGFEAASSETKIALTAGGTRLAAGNDSLVFLWQVESGHLLSKPIQLRGFLKYLCFSPDGKRLVTCAGMDPEASQDSGIGFVEIWDGNSGTPLSTPYEHPAPVRYASFDSTGSRIITACDDGIARVIDIAPVSSQPIRKDHPFLELAEIVAGRMVAGSRSGDGVITEEGESLMSEGMLIPLSEDPYEAIERIRPELKRLSSESDPYARIGEWFIEADLGSRCSSPFAPRETTQ